MSVGQWITFAGCVSLYGLGFAAATYSDDLVSLIGFTLAAVVVMMATVDQP